jgi:SAM-dependent methyltransferase
MDNREFLANKIISRFDKSFKHRWTIFNETLSELQNSSHICLDIGCGEMSELSEDLDFKLKIGTDILFTQSSNPIGFPFLQSDIYSLPFKNQSIDIILLRFVVEHIELPKDAFDEIYRVLKLTGTVLILTTNILSPIIFIPKIIPYKYRKKILLKIFKAGDEDIFPTYHRINSLKSVQKLNQLFTVQDWYYVQDINWSRKSIFYFFLIWHLFTKWTNLKFLRSNFIVLLQKPNP